MAFPITPLAYWKLEDVNAFYGGYNFTNNGTVTFPAGKINNGADFNGSSMSLNNNSVLGATSYPRSFSMWVKFDSVTTSDRTVFSLSDGIVHYYVLKCRSSDSHLVFRSNNATDAADVDTGIVLQTATWYHVVVVQHSATSVSLYVNNTKTNTTATTFTATVSEFYIGYLGRSSVWYLDGIVDEIGIWNKALSDAEVSSLYNSGNGASDYLTLANVSYYKFDSGALTTDSVGANTLTNNNTVGESASGKIGYCADNGTAVNKYFSVASNMGIAGNGSFSYACWVKLNSEIDNGPPNQWFIFNHSSTTTSNRYFQIEYQYNGGTRRIRFNNSGGSSDFYTLTMGTSNWYHFAVSRSGTTASCYINGVLVLTCSQGSDTQGANRLLIGGDGTYGIKGLVDEAGFWSRALLADEISQLYNSNRALAYPLTAPTLYGGIAYLKLDESSGNPTDYIRGLTYTNNNTVAYSAGKIGNGADFVAANSEDFVIPSTLPDLNSNTPFSFSFWIKNSNSSGNYFISTRCNTSAHAQWNIFQTATPGLTRVSFEISPANSAANRMNCYNTSGNAINDGNWHHVAITYNGSRLVAGVKIYIDGTSASVAIIDTNTLSSNAPTGSAGAIGSRTATFGSYYTGSLDEFAIFNKELSSTEVALLYNSGTGLQYPWAVITSAIKSLNGLVYASVKSKNGLAMASIKSVNGLA